MSQKTILQKYKGVAGCSTDSAFAVALDVHRAKLSQWFQGTKPTTEYLQRLATQKVGEWEGDFAVELLVDRGLTVPCVCQTEVWDNGDCPKHGKTPLKASQMLNVSQSTRNGKKSLVRPLGVKLGISWAVL